MKKTINKIMAGSFAALCSFALLSGCASTSSGSSKGSGKDPLTSLAAVERKADKPYQGVYYSLFVRSFADSDGDGVGDFKGITQKLDYLNDGDDSTTSDLGITGIWLLPIYPSQSYHGYDVDDYYNVNPQYGTMADFEELVAECNKRGISVILDMTCNHSSRYTEWFTEGRDPEDPHHSWYRWITADDTRYNLNQSMWGHKVWNEDFQYKGNYFAGLFGPHMPDFNLDSPELREEFKKVMKFWMDKGVAGFRYDAAGHVYNSAKTPAGENGTYKAVEWWKELIDFNKSVNPDSYNVGEVWENSSTRATFIEGLGSDFHFDMGPRIVDDIKNGFDGNNSYAAGLEADLEKLREANPYYIDAPFLSNHDQARAAGQLRADKERCKAAAAMYMLTEGVPFMYYGEEIGMLSGTDDPSKRTPMLWNGTSERNNTPLDKKQTTWKDSIYNKNTVPVAKQEKDPSSLLTFYKRLIRLRTSNEALYAGRLTALATGNDNICSWKMTSDNEEVFVMVNVNGAAQEIALPAELNGYTPIFYSSNDAIVTQGDVISATVPAFGTIVLKK